ncbi:MAG: DUF6056 family protein [Lachnospiraceae bacterium]|jgi:hypothetical protein|nr:DUF6056 family protein [Lachnospiraceae bacterium]
MSKICFGASLVLAFVMIFFYIYFTPYLSDDIHVLVHMRDVKSFHDFVSFVYNENINNPRIFGHLFVAIFVSIPKAVFNIINSLVFVLLVFLIYDNVTLGLNKKQNSFFFLLTLFFFWRYAVAFGDTILWLSGAANYMWLMTIILGFTSLARRLLAEEQPRRNPLIYVIFAIMGIAAGWCNENTSGGLILLIVIFVLLQMIKNIAAKQKVWSLPMIIAPLSTMIGFILMVLMMMFYTTAAFRLEDMSAKEGYTGVTRFFYRIYYCLMTMHELFFELLIVFAVLTIFLIVRQKKLSEACRSVFPFFIAGIATCFALALIAPTMPRAYFGGGVFLVIACLRSLVLVFGNIKEESMARALAYSVFAILGIWLFFDYSSNLVNLARIEREENERVAIIKEAKENNLDIAIVPQLRPQFATRYSHAHHHDMIDDDEYWINWFYEQFYGVKVRAIPREDYDALLLEGYD